MYVSIFHRDIPMPLVSSYVEQSNLRKLALAGMRDLEIQCQDICTWAVESAKQANKIYRQFE